MLEVLFLYGVRFNILISTRLESVGNISYVHWLKMCSVKKRQLFNIVTRLWTEREVHRDSIPGRASDFYNLFRINSRSRFHRVPLQVNREPITYPHVMKSLRILPPLCQ